VLYLIWTCDDFWKLAILFMFAFDNSFNDARMIGSKVDYTAAIKTKSTLTIVILNLPKTWVIPASHIASKNAKEAVYSLVIPLSASFQSTRIGIAPT